MSSVSIARQRGLYSNVVDQTLPEVNEDISRLREQISSGTRINRPSDGPSDHAAAEELGRIDNKIDRRLSAVADAQSFTSRTQQELEEMANLFAQAKEKGLQAANDTVSKDNRRAIAEELSGIRDEVVDRMNARHRGEYLFGGTRTQTKPFNGPNEGGGLVNNGATYSGEVSGERTVAVGQNKEVTYNITGNELGTYDGGKHLDAALDNLIAAVEPGNGTTDIRANLEEVTEARDHVISKASKTGVISNRLSAAKDQLETTQLNARERQSEIKDTDLARAATDLQRKQTQLQAALKAVATTQKQASLVNFL